MCFSITLGGGGAATWGHKITVTVLKFFFLALSHFILIQSSKVGLAGLFYRWGNGFREVKWLTQCHTTDTWLNWVLTKTLLEVTSLALNNCTTKSHFPSLSSNFLKLSSPVSWISPALALGLIAVIKKFKRTLAFKRHRYTFFIQRKSRWGVQDGHGGCSTVHGALSLMEQNGCWVPVIREHSWVEKGKMRALLFILGIIPTSLTWPFYLYLTGQRLVIWLPWLQESLGIIVIYFRYNIL